ncbi:ParB/RepB/Spo0J family partition protein [Photobacterium leiognathi]|uniref:ParB/RepB/Spo0J family partition protein n=1 Tax=Photobacterium leiognathi TaxID=553611 RepID=UPI0029815B5F|nr:ParB/RepB/Spo0J family partition protein [Photobacterium leiognathi]
MSAIKKESNQELITVHISQIIDAPWGNSRGERCPKKFAEFSKTIGAKGIQNPLQGRPSTENGQNEYGPLYELLCGYGRKAAAVENNIEWIPFIVKDLNDKDAKALMLSDNVDREQLSQLAEAKAARDIIADFEGDLNAVAAHLGWSEIKLKKHLQLLRCSELVQKNIGVRQENGFILTIGHCSELSKLTTDIQDKIFDVIVREKLSVAKLKSKISKAISQPLADAVFNKNECANCVHNSQQQVSLFDAFDDVESDSDNAVCNNTDCFAQKTELHLNTELIKLKQDYGNVIFLTQAKERTTVSEETVGKENFVNACMSCKNCVNLLVDTDHEDKKISEVIENQCVDLECNKKLTASDNTDNADNGDNTDNADSGDNTDNGDNGDNTKKAAAAKGVVAKKLKSVSEPTIKDAKTFIRSVTAQHFVEKKNISNVMSAVCLLSVCEGQSDFTTNFEKLIKLPNTKLNELIKKLTENLLLNLEDNNHINITEKLLSIAKNDEDIINKVKKQWLPSTENLKLLTKAQRTQILEQSGFTEAFKAKFDSKAYNKLLAMKVDDQITAILAFKFDWSDFCPEYTTNIISK